MIVKDEAAIIERCLASVAPWIDAYAVHDTGSVDGTPDLVAELFRAHGVPGRVTHGTFDDFAQARNDSLDAALAASSPDDIDYLLLCDADMELVVQDHRFRERLVAEAYLLEQRAANLSYANLRLLRRDVPARYRGVTHEYLDIGALPPATLGGAWFLDHAEGSSRDVKLQRDLALLGRGLAEEPDNARYVFYLAQTLRDLGRDREAVEAYERRASMGGWAEEAWYSLFQVALLRERLGEDDRSVVEAYLTAFERRPTRAETLVELSRYLREHGARHDLAHVFATRANELTATEDVLFVTPSCYGWRARDELAITSYWVGRFEQSAALAASVLLDPDLPAEERDRIERNLAFARERC